MQPSPSAVPDPATSRPPTRRRTGGHAAAAANRPHPDRLILRVATPADREIIYALRHDVYARELHQHHTNTSGRLTDPLDEFNTYLVVSKGSAIHGFVSITPPGPGRFSIDKYFRRDQLPFPVDDRLYEVRLLTVPEGTRRWLHALALMYAAFRWVEARGGTRIVAIGRREILSMHLRVGLKPTGLTTQAGAVAYNLIQATMQDVHDSLPGIASMLDRIEQDIDWRIGVPYRTPAPCYHGGDFFHAVGDDFESLERLNTVISADVLDAWFPPSPKVVAAVRDHLPRLLQTSPPTGCEGFIRAVSRARGVPAECILPGAGSSDLIFRAFTNWLRPDSRVLLLDPTYGEYTHVLEHVVRCRVQRLVLRREDGYRLDPSRVAEVLAREAPDLFVLVNPNSPTGQHVPRAALEPVLRAVAASTRIWVDETYADYAGPGESVEGFAAASENVVVCKSMSKTYALSGARVAYLCGSPHQLEGLRAVTPPWVLGLPAQVAAVAALRDPDYYLARYAETHALRSQLARGLAALGWDVLEGVCNFVLCQLPPHGPDAATVQARCREQGVYLRGTHGMGTQLGDRSLRVAVKDAATNQRIVDTIRQLLQNEASDQKKHGNHDRRSDPNLS